MLLPNPKLGVIEENEGSCSCTNDIIMTHMCIYVDTQKQEQKSKNKAIQQVWFDCTYLEVELSICWSL
jgi:hypothetical protein